MRSLRFNHVYFVLLLFCGLVSIIPTRFTEPVRAQFQNVYAPVSRPADSFAQWLVTRFHRTRTADPASPDAPRSDEDIRQENLELRQMVASLTAQVQKLQEVEAQHAKLGKLRDLCTSYSVTAGDSGSAETLLIGGTNLDGLKAQMPAIYPGGLAGWLMNPGLTGSRVRLITDRGFRQMTGVFARFVKRPDGHVEFDRIPTDPQLVIGEGNNRLLIEAMPQSMAEQIHVNDWLLLDDTEDWPASVQGQPLGRVTDVPQPSRRSPGFDEIHLEPAVRLMNLHELMIVDKGK